MTFRFLVSFHYKDGVDLDAVTAAYGGPCQMFADSGAFSAATLGTTIKLTDYAAWLHDWRQVITTAATLDVIGDPDATHRNTLALEDRGLRVLPVFHVGTPWHHLERLCADYRYVALGGMVPHAKNRNGLMRWLVRCFKIAADHGTVFHGFGQTRDTTLAALPFYSVDSSTWTVGAQFGRVALWDDRRHRIVNVEAGNPVQARQHAALLRAHNADPAVVARPGFALLKQRTPEQFEREYQMTRGAAAIGYHRFGEWLTGRHRVPAPPGWTGEGTHLYLADTHIRGLQRAMNALRPFERNTTP